MKNLTLNIDHFENEFEEHADIFDTVANAVPGASAARGILGSVGGILGIGTEDKSDTGFKAALASGVGNLPFFPTMAEVLQAANQGGWEKVEPAAITASYNPSNGTWKRGDWNFKITQTNPIQAKQYKGAKESGTLNSNVQTAIPRAAQPVAVQSAPTAIHTSTMPAGSVLTGTPANTTGAANLADVSGLVKNIPGGNTTLIIVAVLVVVTVVILFIAKK